MLKIPVKKGNIERSLKEYKRKFKNTKVKEELNDRKKFTKPSEKNRIEKGKAIYVRKKNEES
jgi:small subunit ribosomal protein S21|tara:strand:- start:883 stop:1068 length:186 start_codon:yes stop_codon:yes gene_type:complete